MKYEKKGGKEKKAKRRKSRTKTNGPPLANWRNVVAKCDRLVSLERGSRHHREARWSLSRPTQQDSLAPSVKCDKAKIVSSCPPCSVLHAWLSQEPGGCRVTRVGCARGRGWPTRGVYMGGRGVWCRRRVDREPASREDQLGG